MEVYIGPAQENSAANLSREQVLEALTKAGLAVKRTEEKAATGRLRDLWILSFDGSDVSLQFQETKDGLVFATLEQSMFDNSTMPDRICGILESLGWEVDQESVG